MFTEETKKALQIVSTLLIEDMPETANTDQRAMAETTLDADHLANQGYPDAAAEITSLCAKNGYEAVLIEAEEYVVYD